MKLYYHKELGGNFGDDLNPWLWDRLLKMELDDDDMVLFLGIGSLINHRIPKDKHKVVFGAGVGYGTVPIVDMNWTIYSVRGPLSARALSVDEKLGVCDSAILLRTLGLENRKKKHKFSYMPHCDSAKNAEWKSMCLAADIYYIDPTSPLGVINTLNEIVETEILITEAMHGAIVADAFRVPWIAVKAYDYINEFKWNDWMSSLGMKYNPFIIKSIWDVERSDNNIMKFKNIIKRLFLKYSIWNNKWDYPPKPKSSSSDISIAIKNIVNCKNNAKPLLSSDKKIDEATNTLLRILSELKNDISTGRYKV